MSPLEPILFGLLLSLVVRTAIPSPTAPTIIFCPSGDTALLEGRHDRPFKCGAHSDCPAGFDCRLLVVSGGMAGGVCCPDLAKLNLIYGESGQQPQQQKTLLELSGFPPVPSYADNSVMRNRVERLEQRTLRWRPRALAATNSPSLRPHWTAARKLLDREKYSCKRQRLDYHCNEKESRVRRQTQFVVRWYFDLKEEKCLFYPWGYCTGDPIASDSTLRTREECELLCTPPPQAATDTAASTPVLELNAPTSMAEIHEPWWSRAITQPSRMADTILPTLITTPTASATTEVTGHTISASQARALVVGAPVVEMPIGCEKRSSYRSTCPNGLPSQFTLRWYSKDGACVAYAYGHCSDELLKDNSPIDTEGECRERCLRWRGASVV